VKLLEQLLDQLRRQPAAYAVTGLGALAALVIAFGHLSVTNAGILSGAATATGTIITAVLARPVNFTVISGAAATILQALVLFNVHLSSGEIAAVVGGINFVLGIIAVPTVATPVIALKQAARLTASAGQLPLDADQLARKIAAILDDPGFR
jgi:hypothetical protein